MIWWIPSVFESRNRICPHKLAYYIYAAYSVVCTHTKKRTANTISCSWVQCPRETQKVLRPPTRTRRRTRTHIHIILPLLCVRKTVPNARTWTTPGRAALSVRSFSHKSICAKHSAYVFVRVRSPVCTMAMQTGVWNVNCVSKGSSTGRRTKRIRPRGRRQRIDG